MMPLLWSCIWTDTATKSCRQNGLSWKSIEIEKIRKLHANYSVRVTKQNSPTEFSDCATLTQGHRNPKRGKRNKQLVNHVVQSRVENNKIG
jgi:hypothetical protein